MNFYDFLVAKGIMGGGGGGAKISEFVVNDLTDIQGELSSDDWDRLALAAKNGDVLRFIDDDGVFRQFSISGSDPTANEIYYTCTDVFTNSSVTGATITFLYTTPAMEVLESALFTESVIRASEALTNAEIDAIWNGGFSITSTITHGSASGANKILFGTVQITITPDAGYDNPLSVTVVGADASYDEYSGVVTLTNATGNVTITAECEEIPMPTPKPLNEMTWDEIKTISDASAGASYFSVGDCKEITLNGTVGTLALNNYTTCVYILGFDHNSSVEGTGITFGGFKTAVSDGISVALVDANYGSIASIAGAYFNMSFSNSNGVGWQRSTIRYDVLGSVEVKGQQDATSAAVSSPVSNTLMAALPSDLRSKLKPITKWTNNAGGNNDSAENVTSTVDYFALLAEYEIFGDEENYANSAERLYQSRYAFYANGGARKKFKHNSTSTSANYYTRSAAKNSISYFCVVDTNGHEFTHNAASCYGVSPIFLV